MSYLRPGRFEIIAHRGGSWEAPENTMAAFEHAKHLYDEIYFELDVHLTRDNQVVVFHDDILNRVTDGRGTIWEKTWAELQKLDAAHSFTQDGGKTFPRRGQGVRIPLLAEVLEKFPKNRVSIEFKGPGNPFGAQVLKIVDQFEARDRVVLAGAEHKVLVQACALAPGVCSGYSRDEIFWTLFWGRLHLPLLGPRRGDVLQIPYQHKNLTVATADLVTRAHKLGKFVHVWTVNDEATMRRLIAINVDGIITDAPSLLCSVARELKKI
jgi:glycerophosphoryl diester phosphodiesterase